MPVTSIDAYLADVEDPAARKTLEALRTRLRRLLPGASESISYGMPTFKVDGKAVAGFAFFKKHCGLYPFSSTVLPAIGSELEGYATSKGGLSFPPERPLPAKVVKAIVDARLAELAAPGGRKPSARKPPAAKRVLGETANTGFQVGVQRTLPMTADEAWTLFTEHPARWLGAGATLDPTPGGRFQRPKRRGVPAVGGELRVMKPGQRLRMTWLPADWKRPATLQITLTPKPGTRSKTKTVSCGFHMESLPSAEAREAMREHWAGVLGALVASRS